MKEISISQQKLSDPVFYESVFREFYTPLCRRAYRITNDKIAAEDLVQDVFIKIWEKRDTLVISTSVKSYLYQAVMNTCLNWLRSQKKLESIEESNTSNFITENTAEQAEYNQAAQSVEAAINLLPDACRTVFVLSRYEELSNKEIAEKLNISIKTVENQMTKALKFLKVKLAAFSNGNSLIIIGFIIFIKYFIKDIGVI